MILGILLFSLRESQIVEKKRPTHYANYQQKLVHITISWRFLVAHPKDEFGGTAAHARLFESVKVVKLAKGRG